MKIFKPNDGRTEFCRSYIKPLAEVKIVAILPNCFRVIFKGRRNTDIVGKSMIKDTARIPDGAVE